MERKSSQINNQFYDELHETWWEEGSAHPIALLRAENKLRNPWIAKTLAAHFPEPISLLDIGCGGGLLTTHLASLGHKVTGVDCSAPSLAIAHQNDPSGSISYIQADATSLPFPDQTFDVVCAMDLLEHVEHPEKVIAEAGRLLKPGGIFFFHTFSRNLLSYLMIIRGVEWLVKETPPNMHIYRLFLNPEEVARFCENAQMNIEEIHGVRPIFFSKAFLKTLFTRTVDPNFSFRFTSSLATGYSGYAIKCRRDT